MQDITNGGVPAAPPKVISIGASLLQQGVVIPAFAQFSMTGEDNLRIITIGSVTGLTMNIHGRFLDAVQGKAIPFSFTVPVSSNRTATQQDFALGTGYLLNLTAFTSGSPAPLQGQAYVTVQLIRGLGGATFMLGTLLGGYVTNTQPLGWPGSPITPSVSGEPAVRDITGTMPGLGAAIVETCPSGARWELLSVWCSLTTSGVAGSRGSPFLQITSSGGQPIAVIFGQSGGQPAASFWEYTFGQSLQVSLVTLFINAQMVIRTLLRAGDLFTINLGSIQGGDQLSAPGYQVREWLEVP